MHFSTPERKDESYCFNNQGSKMRLTRQMNISSFVHEYHCRQLAVESALLTMIKKKTQKLMLFNPERTKEKGKRQTNPMREFHEMQRLMTQIQSRHHNFPTSSYSFPKQAFNSHAGTLLGHKMVRLLLMSCQHQIIMRCIDIGISRIKARI